MSIRTRFTLLIGFLIEKNLRNWGARRERLNVEMVDREGGNDARASFSSFRCQCRINSKLVPKVIRIRKKYCNFILIAINTTIEHNR